MRTRITSGPGLRSWEEGATVLASPSSLPGGPACHKAGPRRSRLQPCSHSDCLQTQSSRHQGAPTDSRRPLPVHAVPHPHQSQPLSWERGPSR